MFNEFIKIAKKKSWSIMCVIWSCIYWLELKKIKNQKFALCFISSKVVMIVVKDDTIEIQFHNENVKN